MFDRTHSRTVSANPLSFFAVSNLYTISEADSRSRSQTRQSFDEELSSAHSGNVGTRSSGTRSSGITALPRWEGIRNPLRMPTRAHVRQTSEVPILEKAMLAKEMDRSGASTPAEKDSSPPSRMAFWLIVAVIVLLIMAVVLGAVLGTFVGRSSAPQPSVTEIPASSVPTPTLVPPDGNTPSPTPSPPAKIASLAVTGYSVPGRMGYFIVSLFSQDTNDYLSRTTFNSSTGNWTRVSNFAAAKKGTPLTTTTLNSEYYKGQENYSFPNLHYQSQIVYLDNNNYLNEWIFSDTGSEVGQAGPLSEQKYMAHADTELASYWPQIMYQGMSGEIRAINYECHRKKECWHDTVLDTTEAANGTSLALIPLENNRSSIGLFYREESGRYVNYKEEHDQPWGIWTNPVFADIIPPTSSMATFSITRSPNPLDSDLNTYLLWQDGNGTIWMGWTDNDGGWKGPITHPAFAGADRNTALTCLTGLTFPDFPLPAGPELSRCYFQAGSSLREVSFDGTSWDVVGNVPIEF